MKRPKIATQVDIARRLGISRQAVGYALGNNPRTLGKISPATRQRVLKLAATLGYRPNEIARSMVRGRTRTIGVVGIASSWMSNMEIFLNLGEALKKAGWRMQLVLRNPGDMKAEDEYINDLLAQRVEGLIVMVDPSHPCAYYKALQATGIPLILRGGRFYKRSEGWVDAPLGMYEMTLHLVNLGHTRIAYAVGSGARSYPLHRVHGFLKALKDSSIALRPDWLMEDVDCTLETVSIFTQRILQAEPRPTAIMYINDEMALVGLHTILSKGLSVPRDISITGFDDLPLARLTWPELTTVRQPREAMCEAIVQAMTEKIEGRRTPVSRVLMPQLIVRQSTGPAPDR